MTKEYIPKEYGPYDFNITAKEIENLYWYLKCHDAPLFKITRVPNGIAEALKIEVWGKEDTQLDISDMDSW